MRLVSLGLPSTRIKGFLRSHFISIPISSALGNTEISHRQSYRLEIQLSSKRVDVVFGAGLVVLLVSTMMVVLYTTQPEKYPLLDPVPPSKIPPEDCNDTEVVQAGFLTLEATANATGFIPHFDPMSFKMCLEVNITNTGTEDITDFHAVKTSVYAPDNSLFYTFDFQDWNATISAGDSVTLYYRNRETRIEQPFDPMEIYARVLVSFANQEAILTTPILFGMFAIE
jgi:hypothetical protein